ncbi:ABC transporter substrate-binding protein [Curtobacterium ammoniigenes]|uniref:ABC transporter substrate-binding protein n=1 Tax=Curtobacterium ammoniigenes TaxID=395387 RepID=UPI0014706064|nr:sugar ABC transporter substrate-binding protein [Curtobacterium ammoniigenes]
MKAALSIGLLPVVIAALAGCSASGGAAASGPSKGGGTITVWGRSGASEVKPLIQAYEKANPGEKVQYTPVADAQFLQKLSNAVRSNSAPDVIAFDLVNAPLLGTEGLLADLSSKTSALASDGELMKPAMQAGQVSGKQYSLPIAVGSSQMIWNKGLFKAAGLNPDKAPANLAEVEHDAEAIHKLDPKTYGFSTLGSAGGAYTGFPMMWADGGQLLSSLGSKQKATWASSPAVSKDLLWLQQMWKSGVMPPTEAPNQDPGGQTMQMLDTGKIGIAFTGTWAISGADAQKQQWGYAAGIPGQSGKLSGFLGGDGLGIVASSKHQSSAWDFLKWSVSSKTAAKLVLANGTVPPNTTQAKALLKSDPAHSLQALNSARLPLSIAYNAVINDPNGPWTTAAQNVIFNGANPATVLPQAATAADKLISAAYNQIGS